MAKKKSLDINNLLKVYAKVILNCELTDVEIIVYACMKDSFKNITKKYKKRYAKILAKLARKIHNEKIHNEIKMHNSSTEEFLPDIKIDDFLSIQKEFRDINLIKSEYNKLVDSDSLFINLISDNKNKKKYKFTLMKINVDLDKEETLQLEVDGATSYTTQNGDHQFLDINLMRSSMKDQVMCQIIQSVKDGKIPSTSAIFGVDMTPKHLDEISDIITMAMILQMTTISTPILIADGSQIRYFIDNYKSSYEGENFWICIKCDGCESIEPESQETNQISETPTSDFLVQG